MNIFEFYHSFSEDGFAGQQVRSLLAQTHWFTTNAVFDPKTGEALPQALSAFLTKVAHPTNAGMFHDRLWRITEHARPSVEGLFRTLNESPRREHALLPVRAVRELDANSFIKLSNRPGRNIREKLAGKPYLQAVRRFQSVNLAENRLLKAFVTRLAEMLELREDCLGVKEDELLPKIQSWLFTDEAQAITRWDNLPPNNTLLSHRDYRRVWDAWIWLQTLDEDIARDLSQLEVRDKTMRIWDEYGRMYLEEKCRFAEMPVLFDYEKFEIRPWLAPLVRQEATKISRHFATEKICEPVCVDLTVLRPRYAITKTSSLDLRDTYLWQEWKNDDESVDIELFNSDAAYLHPDVTSISSTDLFFARDNTLEHLDRAARAFTTKLHETFKNDTFIWLVPDFLNDFELEITRRNINVCFPNAEPLPRSVAAVFEQVDYLEINDGFTIVVADTIGGKNCVTKLIARRDPELKKRLPESRGFCWERFPEVILPHEDAGANEKKVYEIDAVDDKSQWRTRAQSKKLPPVDTETLKRDKRIGQFAFCINLTSSPVTGGIRLHSLQQRAGDIPLWRDRLPELSIEVFANGVHDYFYLVSRKMCQAVIPRRGMKTSIKIDQHFTLRASECAEYRFQLNQGEGKTKLEYDALLCSHAFPLKQNTECRLELTYEYGADDPYELRFIPVKDTFPPVRVAWRPVSERHPIDLNALPLPTFPLRKSWDDFRRWPRLKPDKNGSIESDLLDWIIREVDKLKGIVQYGRVSGTITKWFDKGEDNVFCFVEDTLVRPSDLVAKKLPAEGTEISFFKVTSSIGKFRAVDVAVGATPFPGRCFLEKVRFPVLTVWQYGHSLCEADVPDKFHNALADGITNAERLMNDTEMPESLREELFFFLCCIHKDMPDSVRKELLRIVDNVDQMEYYWRHIAFAIGDCSLDWQKKLFDAVIKSGTQIRIKILAITLWRHESVIFQLTIQQVSGILSGLVTLLENARMYLAATHICMATEIEFLPRTTSASLELLLAILRTRQTQDKEMKKLLSPDSEYGEKFVFLVDNITKMVVEKNYQLQTRIVLEIIKSQDADRVPDLLYALRLYLTGDDGANAIHITSVSDNDND